MIHNPQVNADTALPRAFNLLWTPWPTAHQLGPDFTQADIVIIPAFGTTLEIERDPQGKKHRAHQIQYHLSFCRESMEPQRKKVGKDGYTIVVHGKPKHEETRAAFSHSKAHTPTVVVKDMKEARRLALYITGQESRRKFLYRI